MCFLGVRLSKQVREVPGYFVGHEHRHRVADLRVLGQFAFPIAGVRVPGSAPTSSSSLSMEPVPIRKRLQACPLPDCQGAWLAVVHIVIW